MENLFALLQQIVDAYPRFLSKNPVITEVNPTVIRNYLRQYDFAGSVSLTDLTKEVNEMFAKWSMHVPHPGYLGLFNPAVSKASIIADALVALYNPQLAVWAHGPVANEIERHVLHFIAQKIGYQEGSFFANFTSGGSEANHTALLAAFAKLCPAYLSEGVFAFQKRPVVYVSEAAHNSFDKIIKNIGFGLDSLRRIPVDKWLKINIISLQKQLKQDIENGYEPAVLVGTAGTTASGTIEPLTELAAIAGQYHLWFHVDAAWAGAAVLSPKLRSCLKGIELADSVTIDAHKWLSVSMGAGMFFTRYPSAVQSAFNISASYMPSHLQTEPYVTTLQWSRRCIGLKLFMTLAEKGEQGIAQQIEYHCELARYLKEKLISTGWLIVNDSPVGVLNFTHPGVIAGIISAEKIQKDLEQDGSFWISTVTVGNYGKVLRACVTSTHTTEGHIDQFVQILNSFVNGLPELIETTPFNKKTYHKKLLV